MSKQYGPFFITTAIAYPNGMPHMGHAYEVTIADFYARYYRMRDKAVFFSTGTDEHGLKLQQTAEKNGMAPQAFVDDMASHFQKMCQDFSITADRFIRTTEQDHIASAQKFWNKLNATGDIFRDQYSGWYSVRDECYYQEDETFVDADQVRRATSTKTEVKWFEETNYVFRLSAYQDRLLDFYEANPDFVFPASRYNEVKAFVSSGLKDLSISRTTFKWGVPVPGDPDHVMYVWVDALSNYLTVVGYQNKTPLELISWPPDLQIVGKDIIRFHAVYWLAFLLAIGMTPPKQILTHGFLLHHGEKMSKSSGVALDTSTLVERVHPDVLRYFLMREISLGQDGNVTLESIYRRYHSDLANGLGNLTQRCLTMLYRLSDRLPHRIFELTPEDTHQLDRSMQTLEAFCRAIDRYQPQSALSELWALISSCDTYFNDQKPWAIPAQQSDRLLTVLYVTTECLRRIAILLTPVMPNYAEKLFQLIGVTPKQRTLASFSDVSLELDVVAKPYPLFPRIEFEPYPSRSHVG